jgi:hypothetical protein
MSDLARDRARAPAPGLRAAFCETEKVIALLREHGLDWNRLPGQARYEVRVGLGQFFLRNALKASGSQQETP